MVVKNWQVLITGKFDDWERGIINSSRASTHSHWSATGYTGDSHGRPEDPETTWRGHELKFASLGAYIF